MNDRLRGVSRRDFLAAVSGGLLLGGAPLAAQRPDSPALFRRIQAGAAAVEITPKPGVVLDGTIMQIGPVKAVHDPLFVRCLVLDDGRQRLAIAVADCTMISREVFDRAKKLAEEKTGLAADRMLFSATHSHSAVRAIGIGQDELDREYLDQLARGFADAVAAAVENLVPAEIGWGAGSKPELVFNRRWLMKSSGSLPTPFGTNTDRAKMNPPRGSAELVEPAGPVDPQVSVLSVRTADGQPLAVLANFGIHYCGGFKTGEVSADYFGVFSRRIAELLQPGGASRPVIGIVTNGTSGDVSNGFDFRKPMPKKAPYQWMEEVGTAVADEVCRVCRGIEHLESVSLEMRECEIELGIRRPDEARLEWARKVWSTAEGKLRLSRPEIYAREAILLADYPATVPVKLQAIRIGSLGIVGIPCEVFAETGLAIKESSPLRSTFVVELAGGYHGYLPTPRQHALGGYETWPARSACLEVEAEPKIRRAALDLLSAVAPK
jgi:hypothetical protein